MRGFALLAASSLAALSAAQMDGSEYVKVDVGDGLIPSQTNSWLAAVIFNLEEGWHIYWKNPGDSGAPPEFKWTLPEGVMAGKVIWPAPHRIDAGGIVSYGYEGEVVLMVEMSVAKDFPVNKPVDYKLEVDYLVCKDLCLPGNAKLSGNLPFQGVNGARTYYDRYPKQARPDSVTFAAKDDEITLTFTLPETPKGGTKSVYFFPATGAVFDHEAQQKWHLDGTKLILQVKRSKYATTPFNSVEGVLVLTWPEPGGSDSATRQMAIEYSKTKTQEKSE